MENQPEEDAQRSQPEQQLTPADDFFLHSWRTEETLLQKWEELLFLVETIPQLVWVTQPDGFAISFNRRWYEYTGAKLGEHEGDMWVEALHPEDRAKTLVAWHHALETGEPYEIEYRLRKGKTGEYHWFLARGMPFTDDAGYILKWFGTCTDIDEQKQAEEALRLSRDTLQLLLEAMPQMVWTTLPDGFGEYANRRWISYTGMSLEDLQDNKWITCYYPDDRNKLLTLWHHARLTSQPYELEARIRSGKTGEYRWFLNRAVPLLDAYGKVWRWFGTCTDIHEQKRTEAALRESELRFRRLMDANIIGIIVVDLEGNFYEANQAFFSLVGYNRRDMVSGRMRWTTMTPPEYREKDQQAINAILSKGVFQPFEKEYWTKDGRRVPVLVGGTILSREDKKPRVIAFILDLTARKALEQSQTTHQNSHPTSPES